MPPDTQRSRKVIRVGQQLLVIKTTLSTPALPSECGSAAAGYHKRGGQLPPPWTWPCTAARLVPPPPSVINQFVKVCHRSATTRECLTLRPCLTHCRGLVSNCRQMSSPHASPDSSLRVGQRLPANVPDSSPRAGQRLPANVPPLP